MMEKEECKDRCVIMEGKCADKCDNMMNRQECGELGYCSWLFSKHSGDDGRCVWKNDENCSCSDIKRYNDCYNGGNLDILFNKCEYYKDRCRERCSLILDKDICLKEERGDCMWLNERREEDGTGRCILKVLLDYIINYLIINEDYFVFISLCFSLSTCLSIYLSIYVFIYVSVY
jgi:hypothetical protein